MEENIICSFVLKRNFYIENLICYKHCIVDAMDGYMYYLLQMKFLCIIYCIRSSEVENWPEVNPVEQVEDQEKHRREK